jgi:hypothetical protein
VATQTVRITAQTHARLRELAGDRGESLQDVLAAAVDRLWRDQLLTQLDEDYAQLRADPAAWEEELAERRLWETASPPWPPYEE